MARRALLVGIDAYPGNPLQGCVSDADRLFQILTKNEDGSPNFECRKLTAPPNTVSKAILTDAIQELFAHPADVALLYFSGHGASNNLGGFLVTQDAIPHDLGFSMEMALTLANDSRVGEVVIILDCCHSGSFGQVQALNNDRIIMREGISVLTASRASQVAISQNNEGIFTGLVCDALLGGAADLTGDVTVARVYAYVDQLLGSWGQRPLFKAHVSKLIPLRKCSPIVPREILRLLPEYFPNPDYDFPLDPSFEPTVEPRDPKNEAIFGHLQKYRALRILVPVGEEHMFYAATKSASCKLTELGKFYWHRAKKGTL